MASDVLNPRPTAGELRSAPGLPRPASGINRCAFLVHPLLPLHRRILGVRQLHFPLAIGGPAGIDGVAHIADLELPTRHGPVSAAIIAVPDLAHQLVADQHRAFILEQRAARLAEASGATVIGLGSALAVVAGRGQALAEHTSLPVTTGQAATAWACATIAERVFQSSKEPIGVLGFAGTVGEAVAQRLIERGFPVMVDATGSANERRAQRLGATCGSVDEVVYSTRNLVGASTTGPILDPARMPPNRTLVDLALPPTLGPGPRPKGWTILGGETLEVPGRRKGGFWGTIWLGLAGYGSNAIYACLAEPATMAICGETGFSAGRHLDPKNVARIGGLLLELGFEPCLRKR